MSADRVLDAVDWADSPAERAERAVQQIRRAVSDRYDREDQSAYALGALTSIISRHPDALAELVRYAETTENAEAKS